MAIKKGQWIDNDTGDVLYPQTSADMVVEDSSHRFVTDTEKSNWNSIPRDNILINSDFRQQAINQRGASTYGATSSWKYSIDRWMYFGQMSVSHGSDRITLQANSSNSGYSYFKQLVEGRLNGTYTLYVKVLEVSGNVQVDVNGGVALKTGENIITFTTPSSGIGGLQINLIGTSAKVVISHMKLEEGKAYTGMPVWNRTLEILKCCRYYFAIRGGNSSSYFNASYGTATSTTEVACYVDTAVSLRVAPTVTFANVNIVSLDSSQASSIKSISAVNLGGKPSQVGFTAALNSSITRTAVRGQVLTSGHLVFDAEIY